MYCGRKLGVAYMHADHKTPLSQGGTNSKRNFQLLCGPCNTRKGRMTHADFRRKYKLTAKGPPTPVIRQSYFEQITKQSQVRRRSRRSDSLW